MYNTVGYSYTMGWEVGHIFLKQGARYTLDHERGYTAGICVCHCTGIFASWAQNPPRGKLAIHSLQVGRYTIPANVWVILF